MKIATTDFRIKFSEFFPKVSGRIQTHPDASQCIRALPSRSQQVRASPKPSKNLRKTCENFAIFFFSAKPLVLVTSLGESTRTSLACFSALCEPWQRVTGRSLYLSKFGFFSRFFRYFFEVFASFWKFLDLFRPVRNRSDLFGCIRTRLDGFECVGKRLDVFGNFGFLDKFLGKCFDGYL